VESSRDYMTQTSNGNTFSNNNAKWSFEWKAPSSNVGDIILYVALNVTNADKTDNGESEVYIKQFTFSPSSKLPVASISSKKNTIRLGDTLSLQGSSTNNATDWAWSVSPCRASGSGLTTTSQDCKFTFTAAGNYKHLFTQQKRQGVLAFRYRQSNCAGSVLRLLRLPVDRLSFAREVA
jgi:PKD repeat protein